MIPRAQEQRKEGSIEIWHIRAKVTKVFWKQWSNFLNKKPTHMFRHLFLFLIIHIHRRTTVGASPCSSRALCTTTWQLWELCYTNTDRQRMTERHKNVKFWVQLLIFGILFRSLLSPILLVINYYSNILMKVNRFQSFFQYSSNKWLTSD